MERSIEQQIIYRLADFGLITDCTVVGGALEDKELAKKIIGEYSGEGDGVQYFILKSNDTASSGTQIQHCIVANGVKGSESSPISQTVNRNLKYETKIAYNSSGTLKKFCTGD